MPSAGGGSPTLTLNSNIVILKRSAVPGKIPLTTDIALGEIAINTYNGNLFFKKDDGITESIVTVATSAGTQTLSNKTLSAATLTGTLTAGGGVGTNGQVLTSTGTGVQWSAAADVTLTGTQTLSNKTLVDPILATIGGNEGGQINFGPAATNTTLVGNINVDIYQNLFRIFEGSGTNRGVSLDLSAASASVGSSLVTNNGTQTLTNKTLSGVTLTGAVTAGGNTGANGYILTSTGTD